MNARAAWVIAERFREAVERHDWTTDDPRLVEKPVRVDVGIVCLMLSDVAERRPWRASSPRSFSNAPTS